MCSISLPPTLRMFHKSAVLLALAVAGGLFEASNGFQVAPKFYIPLTKTDRVRSRSRASFPLYAFNDKNDERSVNTDTDSVDIWSTSCRKIIAGLSTVGAAETGYLSYIKLYVPDGIKNICGDASSSSVSSCSSVLNSPYASIQIGDFEIPLTVFGFAAYSSVALLSLLPMLKGESGSIERNENNRIALLGITTSMATFSSFLLSPLFNNLHQSCLYCLLLAALSILMGLLSWFCGALPMNRRQ
mgnify:CR=1 FL=1